jgi:hypothetical protein
MNSSSSTCTWSGGPSPGATTVSRIVTAPPVSSPRALYVSCPAGAETSWPSPGRLTSGLTPVSVIESTVRALRRGVISAIAESLLNAGFVPAPTGVYA